MFFFLQLYSSLELGIFLRLRFSQHWFLSLGLEYFSDSEYFSDLDYILFSDLKYLFKFFFFWTFFFRDWVFSWPRNTSPTWVVFSLTKFYFWIFSILSNLSSFFSNKILCLNIFDFSFHHVVNIKICTYKELRCTYSQIILQ